MSSLQYRCWYAFSEASSLFSISCKVGTRVIPEGPQERVGSFAGPGVVVLGVGV